MGQRRPQVRREGSLMAKDSVPRQGRATAEAPQTAQPPGRRVHGGEDQGACLLSPQSGRADDDVMFI